MIAAEIQKRCNQEIEGALVGVCGMIGNALFGVFLTPVFFFVLSGRTRRKRVRTELPAAVAATPHFPATAAIAIR